MTATEQTPDQAFQEIVDNVASQNTQSSEPIELLVIKESLVAFAEREKLYREVESLGRQLAQANSHIRAMARDINVKTEEAYNAVENFKQLREMYAALKQEKGRVAPKRKYTRRT